MGVDEGVRQHADQDQRDQADGEAHADEGTSESAPQPIDTRVVEIGRREPRIRHDDGDEDGQGEA